MHFNRQMAQKVPILLYSCISLKFIVILKEMQAFQWRTSNQTWPAEDTLMPVSAW